MSRRDARELYGSEFDTLKPLPTAPFGASRAIFDASPFATAVFDFDLVVIDVNDPHVAMTGLARDHLVGRMLFDAFPSNPGSEGTDTEAAIRSSVARVRETGARDELPIQRHDLPLAEGGFEPRYWRLIHSPIAMGGKIVAIRQDSWDVTDAVVREQRLLALQSAATAISNVAFWDYDFEHNTFVRSAVLDDAFGFLPGEVGPSAEPFFERIDPDDVQSMKAMFGELWDSPPGTSAEQEMRVWPRPGEERLLMVYGVKAITADGRKTLIGTSLDISKFREQQRQLEELLHEKDVLLGEINHRVKNSMQIVLAILSIASFEESDPKTKEKLALAADRVRAVASVHGTLYHSDDMGAVDIGRHIRRFCSDFAQAVGAASRDIHLEVDVIEHTLNTQRAVNVSLILHELLSNVFKHAFDPARFSGTATVRVSLRLEGERLVLRVSDNGVGSNSLGNDGPRVGSMGSKLVKALADQLGADRKESNDDGWTTELSFLP